MPVMSKCQTSLASDSRLAYTTPPDRYSLDVTKNSPFDVTRFCLPALLHAYHNELPAVVQRNENWLGSRVTGTNPVCAALPCVVDQSPAPARALSADRLLPGHAVAAP